MTAPRSAPPDDGDTSGVAEPDGLGKRECVCLSAGPINCIAEHHKPCCDHPEPRPSNPMFCQNCGSPFDPAPRKPEAQDDLGPMWLSGSSANEYHVFVHRRNAACEGYGCPDLGEWVPKPEAHTDAPAPPVGTDADICGYEQCSLTRKMHENKFLSHHFLEQSKPVGACDHVKDNDDQMNGCPACKIKPVGRETGELAHKWVVRAKALGGHYETVDRSVYCFCALCVELKTEIAAALADALAKLKIVEDAYDDGVVTTLVEAVTEGTEMRKQIADLQRRLDEAVGHLWAIERDDADWKTIYAFLAAERKGEK